MITRQIKQDIVNEKKVARLVSVFNSCSFPVPNNFDALGAYMELTAVIAMDISAASLM
jgi:uncharacterized protein YozE (UPF0346 family)